MRAAHRGAAGCRLKRPVARAVSGAHFDGLVGNAGKLSPPDQHVWERGVRLQVLGVSLGTQTVATADLADASPRLPATGPVRATFDLRNDSEVMVGSKLARRLHYSRMAAACNRSRDGVTARQSSVLHSLEVAGRRFHDAPPLSMHSQVTSKFSQHAVWLRPRP